MAKKQRKEKRGRPSLGRKARQQVISIRVSAIELDELRRKAKAAKLPLSIFIMAPHRSRRG